MSAPQTTCPVCTRPIQGLREHSTHQYPDAGPDDFVVIGGRRYRAYSIVGETFWNATPCGCALTEAQYEALEKEACDAVERG